MNINERKMIISYGINLINQLIDFSMQKKKILKKTWKR
jgi:hypothetical protein